MNRKVAISLSKCLTIVFGLIVLATMFFIPYITGSFDYYLVDGKKLGTPFTVCLYCCAVVGLFVLVFVYQLIHRLEKDQVFVLENATSIRNIGICMFVLAIICVTLAFIRIKTPGVYAFAFSFLFIFLGVIMLTLYSVFRSAVEMKDEQDYTI